MFEMHQMQSDRLGKLMIEGTRQYFGQQMHSDRLSKLMTEGATEHFGQHMPLTERCLNPKCACLSMRS